MIYIQLIHASYMTFQCESKAKNVGEVGFTIYFVLTINNSMALLIRGTSRFKA